MWKVKLDEGVWLTKSGTATIEDEAWLLPDIPSVQEKLEKVRRFLPYPKAIVVAEFDDCPKETASTQSGSSRVFALNQNIDVQNM